VGNVKRVVILAALATACAGLRGAAPATGDPGQPTQVEPALLKVHELFHGTWERPASDLIPWATEARYDWEFNKTAVRGLAIMAKGKPDEFRDETTIGWDPARKQLYFLRVVEGKEVYLGVAKVEGKSVSAEYEAVVGPPGKYRRVTTFPDADTLEWTTYREKDGKWVQEFKGAFKRKK
jgi:hypothetical protein